MTAKAYAGAFAFPNGDTLSISPYLRVGNNSGNLVAAGAAEKEMGLLAAQIFTTDEVGSVEPLVPGCVYRVTASEAWAANADLYRAASGKLSDTPNGPRWGVAIEAASGDGSQVLAQYLPLDTGKIVEAHTALMKTLGHSQLELGHVYG